ncbi:MAG: PKD domain-containing protein [Methanospirillum sp.]
MDVGARPLFGVLVLLLLCAGVQATAANETYEYVTEWGGENTALGPLWYPGAMAVAPDGLVYLYSSDGWPHYTPHIQKFTSSGAFVSTLAGNGLGDGQIVNVGGIVVDGGGNVYVTDEDGNHDHPRVMKFGPGGSFIKKWGSNGTGNGQFFGIGDIAVDGAGYVYVVDTGNRRIQKFDQDGAFVTKWAIPGTTAQETRTPYDIATGPNGAVHVLVSVYDSSHHTARDVVQTYNTFGMFQREWGTEGTADGQISEATCLAADPGGNIYVADYTDYDSLVNRFQKFSPTGQFIGAWTNDPPPYGKADEDFYDRRGITDLYVDGDYTVYAAEFEGARVLLFQVVRPDFTATPSTGFAPLGVQFTDTSIGNPSSCSWNFGDGGHSTDWNPLHTYEAPGTYTVRHNLNSPVWGISDVVKTDLITVHAPLKAGFTAAPRAGYETLAVQFTDTTTGDPATRHWEFGDGSTSTAQHPSHFYAAPGSYTVRLSVWNAVAGTKNATRPEYIKVLPLTGGKVRVEAEDYDVGGEGVAYHDTTAGNSGHVYRENDVDIVEMMRGGAVFGYAVTGTAETEWTQYTVLSPGTAAADYPLTLHIASWAAFQSIGISVNGTAGETVFLPNTNFATTYANVNTTIRLGAGWNTVRLSYHGSAMNVDSFTIDPAGVRPVVLAVPPGTALPTDANADGLYEDVNGNGRKDFADVVLYFNNMTWIEANEPITAFDYNGNDRIDFADVVRLFNNL